MTGPEASPGPLPGTLRGRRVVVTRERPGRLGELLEERGAVVVHIPLIAVADPADGGAELEEHLDRLGGYDWLIVTSPAGAARAGPAARRFPAVRLAAVGASTAGELAAAAGRPVDLVPPRQLGAAIAEAFSGMAPARMLLAVADRAPGTLAAALAAAGHSVTTVTAYRTVSIAPSDAAGDHPAAGDHLAADHPADHPAGDHPDAGDHPAGHPAAADHLAADHPADHPAGDHPATDHPAADALLLASGSAAESWVDRFGVSCPPIVVAIGPSTASVAERSGLKVSAVATDHSLTGLVAELERCLRSSGAV